MTAITINRKNRTIEISKAFDKLASRFGSNEYQQLQEARRDNPGFTIVVKKGTKNNNLLPRLSYKFMEDYITAHDNEEQTIMNDYKILRAISEEAQEMGGKSASYEEVERWFYDTFPQIVEFREKQKKIIEKRKQEALARQKNTPAA